MEQMTLTAKIQVLVSPAEKSLLDNTLSAYRNACNYVSAHVFRTHDLKQLSLNKALYAHLRERFCLRSQMAQSVIKTVIAKYKTILETRKNGSSRLSENRSMILYGTEIILFQETVFLSIRLPVVLSCRILKKVCLNTLTTLFTNLAQPNL